MGPRAGQLPSVLVCLASRKATVLPQSALFPSKYVGVVGWALSPCSPGPAAPCSQALIVPSLARWVSSGPGLASLLGPWGWGGRMGGPRVVPGLTCRGHVLPCVAPPGSLLPASLQSGSCWGGRLCRLLAAGAQPRKAGKPWPRGQAGGQGTPQRRRARAGRSAASPAELWTGRREAVGATQGVSLGSFRGEAVVAPPPSLSTCVVSQPLWPGGGGGLGGAPQTVGAAALPPHLGSREPAAVLYLLCILLLCYVKGDTQVVGALACAQGCGVSQRVSVRVASGVCELTGVPWRGRAGRCRGH